MATSSTTSSRRRGPLYPVTRDSGRMSGRVASARTSSRTVNAKVLPRPRSLVTVSSPPMSRTIRCAIARPRPVPGSGGRPSAACWNGWNSRERSAAAMPTPVSVTVNSKRSSGSSRTSSRTDPRGVNFTALPSRLSRTCRSFCASPSTEAGRAGATVVTSWKSRPFSRARGSRFAAISPSNWGKWKGAGCSSSLPASIFERSSTSLIMRRRCSPLFWTISSRSRSPA